MPIRIQAVWRPGEYEYTKKCFADSYDIDEAVAKVRAKYPHRTRCNIQRKFSAVGDRYAVLFKKREGPLVTDTERKTKYALMEKEVNELRAANKKNQNILEIIHGFDKKDLVRIPKWLQPARRRNLSGMVCLDISDIHHGEIVKPEAVQYYNSFDREISRQRIEFTFKMAIELPLSYFNKPKYDGAVVALNGDLISGNIHEELETTNDGPVLISVVECERLLIQGIELMAKHYGRVYVPCTVGNHGRLRQKKWAKQKVHDSYEWLIYHHIAKHFENDDRVTVAVPEGPDITYRIYGVDFLQTHGDQYHGGGGISGIFTPLTLGAHRKQVKQQVVGKPFHIMKVGHFHQYIHSGNIIVNGSIKGYDEYADGLNIKPEPPQQALYIVHPEHGVTYRMPVQCGGYEKKARHMDLSFFK